MFWKFRKSNSVKKKFVVYHNHIFKNAGSTIDWALKKNFGNGFVDHRDDSKMQKDPNHLKFYIQEHPKICALSSHHLRLPLPKVDNVTAFTIMMFRHPIERVASVYQFERRQTQSDTLGARFAREHDLKAYVKWRLQLDVPPTIRNFHLTKSLPNPVRWRQPASEADLTKAMTYVDSVEMLGFVERFDESMILFESTLRPVYSGIDLSYKIQNVGTHSHVPKTTRIEKLRNALGDSLYHTLLEKNWADLKLYEYALGVFNKRVFSAEKMASTLACFRQRCERHNR